MARSRRKQVLIQMLEDIGEYPGVDIFRTSGEDCAIGIALKLVKKASMRELDQAAKRAPHSNIFWDRNWR